MSGWISLHRQITENPLYFSERFTKMQAWIDILLECNHRKNIVFIRGNEIEVARGQSANSIATWAKRWKWNWRTVEKFLNYLKKHEMIQYRKDHITTIITVINYSQYQDDTKQNTKQNTNRIQTNNNVNNDNNNIKRKINKKKSTIPTHKNLVIMQEVRVYLRTLRGIVGIITTH